ncbi:MAG TPA: MFS transporter [Kineosporiaceae bacterium]|nr:MFS transporter [Kineosporiaceae bacterium]
MARYLRILRRPAALVPFAAAVVARLPISMAALGIVLLIQNVRGSYAIAGTITAALALGAAVAAPGWGRLLDRVGHSVVIAATGTASAGFLAALAVCADHGYGDAVLVALSAGAGLTFPVITPAMRATWRVVLDSPEDRAAAYAMDAVAIETIFVGGPLLLSGLLVLTPRSVPLLVTAGLQAVGAVGYALTPAARRTRELQGRNADAAATSSPLRAEGVIAVLLVALATAIGFGHLDVSIAATARQTLHDTSRVGLLFASIASGSALGGLWYGARRWSGAARRRLPVALGGFTAGLLLLPQVVGRGGELWLLMPLLMLTGLCISPGMIIQQALVDGMAPPQRLGEAQAWLSTAITTGSAAGTALAGILVDLGGPHRSFLGAAAAVGTATALAVVAQRRWRVVRTP